MLQRFSSRIVGGSNHHQNIVLLASVLNIKVGFIFEKNHAAFAIVCPLVFAIITNLNPLNIALQNTDHPETVRLLENIQSTLASNARLNSAAASGMAELTDYEKARINANNNTVKHTLAQLLQLQTHLYNRASNSN